MSDFRPLRTVVARCLALAALAGTAPARAADPIFSRLGSLGGTQSAACGINDHGVVVGSSTTPAGEWHPAVWRQGRTIDLGGLGEARDINNNGAVVGTSMHRPALWRNGMLTLLATDGGSAVAINDHGSIVGAVNGNAMLWTKTRSRRIVGLPMNFLDGASGINERGHAVGSSIVAGQQYNGYQATEWSYLGVYMLPGLGDQSEGVAVNGGGQTVGYSWNYRGIGRIPVRWDHLQPVALENPGSSTPLAINDAGQVVGWTLAPGDAQTRAALWQGQRLVDLNRYLDRALRAQGWVLTLASAISNPGWIAGQMENAATGETAAWLLSAP